MQRWEDWAETWARSMVMVDVLDTATSYGVALLPDDPSEPTLTDRTPVEDASFENLIKRWFPLTYALNSLNRSLGMPDGYPFALASPVVDKLRFVHRVIAPPGAVCCSTEAYTLRRKKNGTPRPTIVDVTTAGPASNGSAASPAYVCEIDVALPTLNVTALVMPFTPWIIALNCWVEPGQ